MSTNHRERVERIVDKALREASLGEPYGLAVNGPGHWPYMHPQTGDQFGEGPAWFILVTIRAAGLGEPDIGRGWAVPGMLPADDDLRTAAAGLLAACRAERDEKNRQAFAAAGPSMKLSERPA